MTHPDYACVRPHPLLGGMMGFTTRFVRGLRVSATAALALVSMSACTVADYQKPISDLATAVDQSISSINKLDRDLTALRDAQWRQDISDGQAKLDVLGETCSAGKSGCALGIRHRGETVEKPFPPTSVIPKAKSGLAGLRTYVDNLQAIVDADTTGKVADSANAALGSVKTIESALADVRGRESEVADTFGKPVVDAVAWLAGQYVLYTKVKALKRAIARAQPVIDDLAAFYNDIADAAATVKLGQALKEYTAAQEAYDDLDAPNAQAIERYVAAAEKFDTILSAVHARPLKAFADAHARLNDQLNGEITLPEALSAIEIFAARAQEFKEIVDDFEQAINDE